ncbi:MBL fold metallo-hydrolase [Colwelliaceae bacterium 6471]
MKQHIYALLLLFTSCMTVAQEKQEVVISVTPAGGDVYMLQGSGGNIGVLATKDGLLLVDDQFKPLAQRIENAMKSIVDKELKYIVNTHFHGDHTGSNSYFGEHAPIFAHENVRTRLSNDAEHEHAALPVVTYKDGINIFLDNEQIQLTHLPNGHTDGDTIVYFKHANVLHTGDLFFEIGFPFIDLKSGGSVAGYLANVRHIIQSVPDDVVIIPGHGKLTDKAALKEFSVMINDCIELVNNLLAQGKTEPEIIAIGVADKYKHLSWSFINEERWLKTLIVDLSR